VRVANAFRAHAWQVALILLALALVVLVRVVDSGRLNALNAPTQGASTSAQIAGMQVPYPTSFNLDEIAPYDGSPAVVVNDNVPLFADADFENLPNEAFSPFDSLGRCGPAYALVGREYMPTERRGSIGTIKPSGWQTARYEWIDGTYLFNRCHLIAYQMTGQNDNELNLITGTRSLNIVAMQPYEDQVASYARRTGNHVMYRVTPVFEGNNLVASGVLMEARSVEDDGAGVQFCVWCYNVEPGVIIDYTTGDNRADPNFKHPNSG